MKERRRLSKKSIEVLSLIAAGHSYSQIVDGHSGLSYLDIFSAAEEALRINESESDYHNRVEQIRTQYPKAYEPWTKTDDKKLAEMHGKGLRIQLLAESFQRQPSAIRSRLAKLGLTPNE